MYIDTGLLAVMAHVHGRLEGRAFCFMGPHPGTQAEGAACILMLVLVVERKRERESMINPTLALTVFTWRRPYTFY